MFNQKIRQLIVFLKSHQIISSIGAIVLVVIVGGTLFLNKEDGKETEKSLKEVEVITLGQEGGSGTDGAVETVGVVESQAQADIKAEYSAPVIQVRADIGDFVQRGQIIAVLQNRDFVASVNQARAGVNRAETQLAQLQKGIRDEGEDVAIAELRRAEANLLNAKSSLLNTLNSSYLNISQAFRGNVDILYSNPTTGPDFGVRLSSGSATYFIGSSYDSRDYNLNSRRREINDILEFWQSTLESADEEDVSQLAPKMIADLIYAENLISDITEVVNDYTADSITEQSIYNPYKTAVSTARTTINNSLTSTRNAIQSVESAQRNLNISEEQYELQVAPPTREEVQLAEANIMQARASLDAAEAQLAKTILRSPVSGSVITLPIRIGEFVSPGQLIAVVANENIKEVKSYISSSEAGQVKVGDRVIIEGNIEGTVGRVSPGLDPETGKVELSVFINSTDTDDILVGETVSVSILSTRSDQISRDTDALDGLISLPLSAVKVTTEGSYVFIVNDDSEVERVEVEIGDISGGNIEIIDGLSLGQKIITNNRGLIVGEKVIIENE